MASSLAPGGCRADLGERRDNHRLWGVPRERVREQSGLPGVGEGGKEGAGSWHLGWRLQRAQVSLGSSEQAVTTFPVPRTALQVPCALREGLASQGPGTHVGKIQTFTVCL